MRVLLDTHAFLWFAVGDARLSAVARQAIEDPANEKLVSPASHWESAIKIGIGKLILAEPFEAFLQRAIQGNGFLILPIEPRHSAHIITLPFHHRDPFDRLLVAQSLVEQTPLVSSDARLDLYTIQRLW